MQMIGFIVIGFRCGVCLRLLASASVHLWCDPSILQASDHLHALAIATLLLLKSLNKDKEAIAPLFKMVGP